jgi:hypothetical protein
MTKILNTIHKNTIKGQNSYYKFKEHEKCIKNSNHITKEGISTDPDKVNTIQD